MRIKERVEKQKNIDDSMLDTPASGQRRVAQGAVH
jgi:hypothetical protein